MLNRFIDKFLNFFELPVNCIVFTVMCSILLFQVIFRVMGMPLAWTEEIARYLFSWIIYLGASRAMKMRQHLKVDIMLLVLKERGQLILTIFGNILSLIFLIVLCYNCFVVVQRLGVTPQFAAGSGVSMIFPYMAPAVGTTMMTIRCIQNSIVDVQDLNRLLARKGEEK